MEAIDVCDGDACAAPLSTRTLSSASLPNLILSLLPFAITFIVVSNLVLYKIFPLLSGQQPLSKPDEHYLPSDAPPSLRQAQADYGSKTHRRGVAALAFSAAIGLAAVLAELILCEISNTVDPWARAAATKVTVPTLLFLLIFLIPFLEIQSLVRGGGWDFSRTGKGRIPKLPWILQMTGFAAWLTCFWWVGRDTGRWIRLNPDEAPSSKSLTDACLDRIGVIGITLMALLSAFASVSSPWQSFASQPRPVTDADIARKQAGLDATNDMLVAKRSRLRALQRKMSAAPGEGFMTKVLGTIRGSADAQEVRALNLEISGLETMARSLGNSLAMLKTRHAASLRAATPLGRCLIIPSYAFSIYCCYRILTTAITTFRRYTSPHPSGTNGNNFSTSDPISRILSLLAKHWDPNIDQAAWSRQISFLLSGIILLASINSVLQTFHLLGRFLPGLLYQAQANAALLVAQVAGMYVISSALLLRSNLPREIGKGVMWALGSGKGGERLEGLEGVWVEGWFDGWFLVGVGATGVGIWVGRKFGAEGSFDDWDDYGGDVELGQKRS